MILSRRAFLVGLGGVALTGCKKDAPAPARPAPPAKPPAKPQPPAAKPATSQGPADTLDHALERLVPGAAELQVRRYIDGQLGLPHFKNLGRMVTHGAKLLEKVARREGGGPFAGLDGATQDQLLARFQTGRIKTKFPTAKWFSVVHTFALEGWLGDPKHGGNAGGQGWKGIGWEMQCPTG